jgi:WD40 repeat protein/serine/threonine protein kinase
METRPVIHPSSDALRAFALGKLDDGTASVLMAHLDGCPDCCKTIAALSGDDFLARMRQAHGHSATPAPAKSLPETVPAAKPLASPTQVPNLPPELANNPQYEILRELGRGGMGVVYLARHRLSGRLEVLKVMNKDLLARPGSRERFLREIQSAARLDHTNVVKMYTALEMGELMVLVMEYVEGESLADYVKKQGPLPVAYSYYYVQQAALGLQHAFEKKMVHRDIKPHNLMLAREGKKHTVKVLDFGLAKATREKKEDTGLTGEGAMLGTPDYVAPEQTLDAAKADIRADIYSLGCTLYYLLTGAPPFKGRSLFEILQAHHSVDARPLNLIRPEVPEELAAVVRRMMAKDPAKRYQTPAEVVQALSLFGKSGAKGTPPKSTHELSVGDTDAKAVRPTPAATEAPKPKATVTAPPPPVNWEALTEESITSVQPRNRGTIHKRQPPAVNAASWKMWLIAGAIAVCGLLLVLAGMWMGGAFKGETPDRQATSSSNGEQGNPAHAADDFDLSGGYRFVVFRPDGPRVAQRRNEDDGQSFFARVYDVTTERPLTRKLLHRQWVNHASLSQDGRRVLTDSQDGTAQVWDAITGEALSLPLRHEKRVNHAAFSPDGKRVVTASSDTTAQVWDAETGQRLGQPLKHDSWVNHAMFSPDGKRVVTASGDRTARVWDAVTGWPVSQSLKHDRSMLHASFSPDSKRVVTASADNNARVWDATTGRAITPWLGHEQSVLHAAFSPDGKRIVTASSDHTARVWDAETARPLGPPLEHEQAVEHASFSPDGKRIVTESWDGAARVWDAATSQLLFPPLKHDEHVYFAAFSPDGKRLVTISNDHTARLWDAETGKELKKVFITPN